jgi:signal transduction histidine kinase
MSTSDNLTNLDSFLLDKAEMMNSTQQTERASSLQKLPAFFNFGLWTIESSKNSIGLCAFGSKLLEAGNQRLSFEEFIRAFHELDKPLVKQMINRLDERKIPFHIEVRFLDSDGNVRWVEIRGGEQPIEGGTAVLGGTLQEITARKTVEREQYRRNQVLEALSSGASLPFILSILCRLVEDSQQDIRLAFWQFQFDQDLSPIPLSHKLGGDYLNFTKHHNFALERYMESQCHENMASVRIDETNLPEDHKREIESLGFKRAMAFLIKLHDKDPNMTILMMVYISSERELKGSDWDQLNSISQLGKMAVSQKYASEELVHRRKFEKLVAKISTRFIRIPTDKIDLAINAALREIGIFSQTDRSYIFRLSDDGKFITNTHEWCNEGIEPQIDDLQCLNLEDIPWSAERLMNPFFIEDVDKMPDEAVADKEVLDSQDIKSIILIPIYLEDKWLGFLGFDSVRKKRRWNQEDQTLLQMVGEIFANTFKRKEAEERTQELVHSNISLERFAYMASHDMKEPLRMVISYLQLLDLKSKKQLSEEAKEYLQYALDGGTRMAKLLEAILAYSRINMSDRPMLPISLDMTLANVLQNLKLKIEESGAELTIPSLPEIEADESQMDQLFQNLISNGLKFQKEGVSPRIEINFEDKGEWYQFSISDNGIGIPKEYREYIFKVFKRLFPRDKYPGSGVGLSICREIVRRHGGQIWLESELQKGTTFYFTLKKKQENLLSTHGGESN